MKTILQEIRDGSVTILKHAPPPPMHYLVQGGLSEAECRLSRFGAAKKKATVPVMMKEQFRFPRSKKQRIRKKWSKQDRNFRYQPSPIFLTLSADVFNKLMPPTGGIKLGEGARYITDTRPHRVLAGGVEFGVRTDAESTFDSGDWERRT